MSLLDSLVYFCDVVCKTPYAEHMAVGVFVGLLFGFARPELAFWAATFLGTGKETIDYFKHVNQIESFNYFTDPQYGIFDGMEDLTFWIIGGFLAFKLLQKGHEAATKKAQAMTLLNTIRENSSNMNMMTPVPIKSRRSTRESYPSQDHFPFK